MGTSDREGRSLTEQLGRIERALGVGVLIAGMLPVLLVVLFVDDAEGRPIGILWLSVLASCGLAIAVAGELGRRFPRALLPAQAIPLCWVGVLAMSPILDAFFGVLT